MILTREILVGAFVAILAGTHAAAAPLPGGSLQRRGPMKSSESPSDGQVSAHHVPAVEGVGHEGVPVRPSAPKPRKGPPLQLQVGGLGMGSLRKTSDEPKTPHVHSPHAHSPHEHALHKDTVVSEEPAVPAGNNGASSEPPGSKSKKQGLRAKDKSHLRVGFAPESPIRHTYEVPTPVDSPTTQAQGDQNQGHDEHGSRGNSLSGAESRRKKSERKWAALPDPFAREE